WTENGDVVSTEAQYSFTVTSNRTLTANFELQTFVITATASPAAGGTVSGAGTYSYNQTAILTATPATGYDFVSWTENGDVVSTEVQYSFTVTSHRTLTAKFELQTFVITATATPAAGGTVSGAGTYSYNQTATLTATPATGYNFVSWTENGDTVSVDSTYVFAVTADRELTANFRLIINIPEHETYRALVFPNPTNGIVSIRIKDWNSKTIAIEIYNSVGQCVMTCEETATEELIRLNLSSLHPGMYYLTMRFNNRFVTERIVLQ
ncbi:MAG: T9SS type A sorting domain-containing protein, partial [Bacteroidales bacterium]|nr:T9SS type A sorting domain-containing protein [Bacteroidales bacterium]